MRKSTNLNNEAVVDGKHVVTMSASISQGEEGINHTSISIHDRELYAKNSKKCRDKISEFIKEVWDTEDSLFTDKK